MHVQIIRSKDAAVLPGIGSFHMITSFHVLSLNKKLALLFFVFLSSKVLRLFCFRFFSVLSSPLDCFFFLFHFRTTPL